jgi:hypothetical protein
MPFADIKDWSSNMKPICAEISERSTPFKILLKTKDEPEMLHSWIEHHSRIVGFAGLVIFDNMSSDPRVEAIYDKYRSVVSVYRYSEFHNLIHNTHYFPSLYAAIRQSCDHFAFLDTDEHLSCYDGAGRFRLDSTIIPFLDNQKSASILPGTWLQNIDGYTDHFSLYDRSIPLKHGLKWGKPIISTKASFDGMINHNTQIEHALYIQPLTTNFFVLHLSRISKQQRIEANLRKLRSYNAIEYGCGLEQFLTVDVEELGSDQVKMYAREIRELIDPKTPERGELFGWIHLSKEGDLTCSKAWQREVLAHFLSNPEEYVSGLFSS